MAAPRGVPWALLVLIGVGCQAPSSSFLELDGSVSWLAVLTVRSLQDPPSDGNLLRTTGLERPAAKTSLSVRSEEAQIVVGYTEEQISALAPPSGEILGATPLRPRDPEEHRRSLPPPVWIGTIDASGQAELAPDRSIDELTADWIDPFAWEQVPVGRSPSGRRQHRMVWDAARQRVVLFGGKGESSALYGDTWEYVDSTWREVSTSSSPGPRDGHSLAYDSERKRVVLFGGMSLGVLMSDTWEYDGGNWTRIQTPSSPPPRREHAAAYDPSRQRIVLFGGADPDGELGDTWEYDGSTWTRVAVQTAPPGRLRHAVVFDPSRRSVLLFGGYRNRSAMGDTWEYDGSTWKETGQKHEGLARYSHAVAGTDSGLLVFGGSNSSSVYLGDTWAYSKGQWSQLTSKNAPEGRDGHSMVCDTSRRRILLFGGYTLSRAYASDTWEATLPP